MTACVGFGALPIELQLHILPFCTGSQKTLSLICRPIRSLVLPILFSTLSLSRFRNPDGDLSTFLSFPPHLGAHVRNLKLCIGDVWDGSQMAEMLKAVLLWDWRMEVEGVEVWMEQGSLNWQAVAAFSRPLCAAITALQPKQLRLEIGSRLDGFLFRKECTVWNTDLLACSYLHLTHLHLAIAFFARDVFESLKSLHLQSLTIALFRSFSSLRGYYGPSPDPACYPSHIKHLHIQSLDSETSECPISFDVLHALLYACQDTLEKVTLSSLLVIGFHAQSLSLPLPNLSLPKLKKVKLYRIFESSLEVDAFLTNRIFQHSPAKELEIVRDMDNDTLDAVLGSEVARILANNGARVQNLSFESGPQGMLEELVRKRRAGEKVWSGLEVVRVNEWSKR
ncbi:hypothetical protein BT69DRAFT_1324752, partial [Atractiella rhizophila]